MKLPESDVKIVKSEGFAPKESFFAIGDSDILMNMIFDKFYSNPIHAICQEIASNARDAHREVGKANVPIIIYIPNTLEPTFKVQDFGPGITPERMENIFIKLGNSTKRDDNSQTGGFGLGAKSPFAYSDSFSVITITNETGNKIQRTYAAQRAEKNKTKMYLIEEIPSDAESTGTTIIIPVKPYDHSDFLNWSIESTKYWTVRPEIRGVNDYTWPKIEKKATGNGWSMLHCPNSSTYRQDYAILITIDEIPYVLDWNSIHSSIDKMDDHVLSSKLNQIYSLGYNSHDKIALDFKIGELTLIANREAIDYCDNSVNKIIEKLKIVVKEMKDSVIGWLTSAKTLMEANLHWSSFDSRLREIVGEVKWNGKIVATAYQIPAISQARVHHYCRRRTQVKLISDREKTITFENKSCFYINDLQEGESERRRVMTLFDDPSVVSVRVLVFPNQESYDVVKNDIANLVAKRKADGLDIQVDSEKDTPLSRKEDWDFLVEKIYINELGGISLASIPKKKYMKMGTGPNARNPMPTYYVFDADNRHLKAKAWEGITEEIDFADGEGIYVELANRVPLTMKGGQLSHELIYIVHNLYKDEDIVGVPQRKMKLLGKGWVTVEDAAKKKLAELQTKLDTLGKDFGDYADAQQWSMENIFSTLFNMLKRESAKIADSKGTAMEYFKKSEEISQYHKTYQQMNEISTYIHTDGPDTKKGKRGIMEKLRNKFFENYPMFVLVTSNYCHINGTNESLVLDYINQMDKIHLQEMEEQAKKELEEAAKSDSGNVVHVNGGSLSTADMDLA